MVEPAKEPRVEFSLNSPEEESPEEDPQVKSLTSSPPSRSDIIRFKSDLANATKAKFKLLAEDVYKTRCKTYDSNMTNVKRIFSEKEELVRDLMDQCPKFQEILSHLLVNTFGLTVSEVDWMSRMTDWGEEECKRVGRSLATFVRDSTKGEFAVDAWRLHYAQLNVLFEEVVGFREFMVVIANNKLRDSIYGMVLRVSVGAALSMMDAATDIYTISIYYKREELYGQANAILAMLAINIFLQLGVVSFQQFQNKTGSWTFVKEFIITMSFLRPAVDAYRVSTVHEDDKGNVSSVDTLAEMMFNRCVELACESVPGCILQLYVWLLSPEKAGTYALVSIAICCLATGFASAMISFDMDVDGPNRKNDPLFFGYIPNDYNARGRCFILMTLMNAMHNLSRSLGCALLAVSDTDNLVFIFVGGEIGLFFLLKILRGDYYCWIPLSSGFAAIAVSFLYRLVVKILVDFTGCNLRHPLELGGLGFTLSLVWAQAFPFVALQFYEGEMKDGMKVFLAVCFIVWLLLNTTFFCTIDLSYLSTFFGTKTGPQYITHRFLSSKEDHYRFHAVFFHRIQHSSSIHGRVKEWVAENIDKWKRENPDWFNIEKIPDEFLPKDVFEAEGGAQRRRSSVSMREIIGLKEGSAGTVQPQQSAEALSPSIPGTTGETLPQIESADAERSTKESWKAVAEKLYDKRSNDHKTNIIVVRKTLEESEEMFAPLLMLCPRLEIMLSFILADRFGFRVKEVDSALKTSEWGEEECKRVGRSLSTFLRKRKTGDVAVTAWRLHYPALNILFEEVEGFEAFMLVIANNTLRDSIYGMVYRVTVGAVLSTVDAATDIYVIATYYKSEELYGQANAMLAMLLGNLIVQLVVVYTQYRRKSLLVIGKETLITMLFLRPAVDAYRVSTNHEDKEVNMDQLSEMVVNKAIELGCESIPGCVLQLYVWLKNPEKAGTYALVSIGISCLTTGFASAMIAFDMDVDVPHRKNQPKFYGYIPNDNSLRVRSFVLMTLMSALHNLSRSTGCALLATFGTYNLVLIFVGCEVGFYLLLKIIRRDFYYWPRLSGGEAKCGGVASIIVASVQRTCAKLVTDFSGCIHMRHPYEMGGLGFTLSLVSAQISPFVALQFSPKGGVKDDVTVFLTVSFVAWLVLNIIFFCTIDLSYLNTFFGSKTAAQYTCERFLDADEDHTKWAAAFENRMEWKKTIEADVKKWVANNIEQWKNDKPDWFNVEKIPDEYLPRDALEAEGGAKRRRRSSVSLREILALGPARKTESRIVPAAESVKSRTSEQIQLEVELWRELAAEVYEVRSNSYKSNFIHLKRIFAEKQELLRELMEQCPKFLEILSHILEDKFGWRVQKVDWTSEMKDWGLEECRRVGCSLATFLRKRKTGEHAIDAWRLHYAQLDVLFKEIDGFEEFMLVIANNTLRDSIYGMIFRVSVGAALSIIDAATDIYVISTYYKSKELVRQANILLVMLLVNIFAQLLQVLANYNKKSWSVFLKEAMITMLLFRPAVDAYRVSTNLQDEGAIFDELSMMMFTKGIELATESIPGCILQLYVWLLAPEKAGTFALLSIGISCLTTGFASAMIAFDMDVDVPHRKNQPKFYGYIPNDNSLRGRCFMLMTLMSSLHNLSRSLGCALLVASDTGNLLWVFVGGEVGLYLFIKILRQDFYYWLPLTGILAVLVSGFQRLCVKVIADFTGCLHLRHPYEMGGLNFIISLVLAQIFPFVSLSFFPDSDMKEDIKYILVVFFVFWLLLNIIFFSTIDLTYLNTFIGVQSAPQYTIGLFLTGQSDAPKFDAVFTCRMAYSQSIHGEVKEWVAANIDQWRRIEPDWFNIELIPDEFLPKDAFEAEGGAKRRRSSVSLREIVGLREGSVGRVHPQAVEEMKVEDT